MKQYLLDTNICISMFKNKQGIREKILDVSLTNCFVSEVTLAELFYGAAKSGREEHFKDVEMVSVCSRFCRYILVYDFMAE